MKVVFLDFDGVLNYRGCLGGRKESKHPFDSPEWYAEELNAECVERLNSIVHKTGAKVVVSSAWRIGRTVEMLRQILKALDYQEALADAASY